MCIYSSDDITSTPPVEAAIARPGSRTGANTPPSPLHEPLRVLVDACHQEQQPFRHATDNAARQESFPASPGSAHDRLSASITTAAACHGSKASPSSPQEYIASPGTESSVSTRLAPLSWFELLANDAANADRSFLLSPPQTLPSTLTVESSIGSCQSAALRPHNQRERESFQAASFHRDRAVDENLVVRAPSVDDPSTALPDESSSWSTVVPIELSEQGQFMFTHFVRAMGAWLDFFDPMLQFSTIIPHLALRNVGLMKALLALSARNLSLLNETSGRRPVAVEKEANAGRTDADPGILSTIDRHVAVQYYYETLHYLNKAMHYPSYTRSAELICTALLISTYEMIDGSNHDWERHLKGVFWIQRYQNNDGECGGIRQAVWWSWLRQDIWVAMRERRRVFSFFQPKKHVSALTASELTCRAHYLLSQCVNYASREESESADIQKRLERGNELLFMLQEWQNCLPREFSPLPVQRTSDVTFQPIWIHPPPYAAAVQLHSLARILVVLHRPSIGGLQDYRAAQRLLTASVSTVCGIARTVKEDNLAANLMSLSCLFGGKFTCSLKEPTDADLGV